MSAEATGWVFRYSPYQGVTFAVHLAIADSVNDQNANEFWMSVQNLAMKARCERKTASRAVGQMVGDGFLRVLQERVGQTTRYRFLFPAMSATWDSRSTPESPGPGSPRPRLTDRNPGPRRPGPGSSEPTNPREPKGTTTSGANESDRPTTEQQDGSAETDPVRSGMARIDRSLRDLCPPDKASIYGDRRKRLKALLAGGADVELALGAIRQGAPAEGAPLRADRAIDAMERGKVPQGDRPPYMNTYEPEDVVIDEDEFARGKARIAEAQAARPDRKREAS